ncbi:MAG: DeoR/GlpR family DNA-binding transcription regulator [Lachnospiraceae bacterium]
MHAIERANWIMATLKENKVVMVVELSRELGVTEETVRKDLEKLEAQQKLNRVHGGAYLNEGFGTETPVTVRSKIMQQEKMILAKRCLELIREKEAIYLDCSTTMLYLAKELAVIDKKLTVMTNSLPVAGEVAVNPVIRLILFGGEYNRNTESFEGQAVQGGLQTCHIDKAFISSAGVSVEAGITDSTRTEAEIRRQIISQAKTCILAADATKIGKNAVYVVGALQDIDYLVTDRPLEQVDKAITRQLRNLPAVILDGSEAKKKEKKKK